VERRGWPPASNPRNGILLPENKHQHEGIADTFV
jgi:hypothetical protein